MNSIPTNLYLSAVYGPKKQPRSSQRRTSSPASILRLNPESGADSDSDSVVEFKPELNPRRPVDSYIGSEMNRMVTQLVTSNGKTLQDFKEYVSRFHGKCSQLHVLHDFVLMYDPSFKKVNNDGTNLNDATDAINKIITANTQLKTNPDCNFSENIDAKKQLKATLSSLKFNADTDTSTWEHPFLCRACLYLADFISGTAEEKIKKVFNYYTNQDLTFDFINQGLVKLTNLYPDEKINLDYLSPEPLSEDESVNYSSDDGSDDSLNGGRGGVSNILAQRLYGLRNPGKGSVGYGNPLSRREMSFGKINQSSLTAQYDIGMAQLEYEHNLKNSRPTISRVSGKEAFWSSDENSDSSFSHDSLDQSLLDSSDSDIDEDLFSDDDSYDVPFTPPSSVSGFGSNDFLSFPPVLTHVPLAPYESPSKSSSKTAMPGPIPSPFPIRPSEKNPPIQNLIDQIKQLKDSGVDITKIEKQYESIKAQISKETTLQKRQQMLRQLHLIKQKLTNKLNSIKVIRRSGQAVKKAQGNTCNFQRLRERQFRGY